FGDDCAKVKPAGGDLLLTVDILVEGVHFLRRYPPETVGWKAVSVNVSDLVGNGGHPKWVLVSLVLPPDLEVSYVERIYMGIKRACDFYGCRVVGGNVSRGEKVILDISAVGESSRPVGRGGARPGDVLFVSGTLGDSRAGLELLLMEKKEYEDFEKRLIERHLRPTARIDYVKHIQKYATASMDISDGLVADAFHLSERSGVRVDIDTRSIPLSRDLRLFCEKHGKDPLEYALFGGEDYQVLFTQPAERWNPFMDMTPVGRISEGSGVYVDGELREGGHRHF
ncbi:MAG: thiamine-phosphate kinase, partial [Aquificota bacterium]|nr:thiamine-phosphate kinase [Aquificota bacterium]